MHATCAWCRSRWTQTLLGLAVAWVMAAAAFSWNWLPWLLSSEIAAITRMLVARLWWEEMRGAVLLLFGIATVGYLVVSLLLRRGLLLSLTATMVLVAGMRLALSAAFEDICERQSCANCRSFITELLLNYADANGGWLPRGGHSDLDSLAKAITKDYEVRFFTSHAKQGAAREEWAATKSLSPDTCCYRYNGGLRVDDPAGLILLYTAVPSRWECSGHRMPETGRACLLHPGPGNLRPFCNWDFLAEPEFQAAQSRTIEYIQSKGR